MAYYDSIQRAGTTKEIRDAKAVRNAAATYSTSTAYAVGDCVTYDGELYRCKTAILSGEAWTSGHWEKTSLAAQLKSETAGINTELSSLKSHLNANIITMTSGAFINTTNTPININSPTTEASYRYAAVACQAGDVFTINARGQRNAAPFAFIDSTGAMLLKQVIATGDNVTLNNYVVTAPENAAYLIINDYANLTSYYGDYAPAHADNADSLIDMNRIAVEELHKGVVFLTGNDFENGSLSGGSASASDVRARSKDYIPISGDTVFHCLHDGFEFEVDRYNASKVHSSDTSYLSGKATVSFTSSQVYAKLVIRDKTAPSKSIDFSKLQHIKFIIYPVDKPENISLQILSFNCGHYNNGSGTEYSGDDMQEKIVEWKRMLAKHKPDIMFGQEMSTYFDAGETVNAINTIFAPLLPNVVSNYYGYGRIVSKIPFVSSRDEDLTVTIDGSTYSRSTRIAVIKIDGVEIALCSAHFYPGYTETENEIREAERDKLIELLSDYDHVIIGGDFNASNDEFYDEFITAGYSVANHGYFGEIDTLPNESVDNIIVKGFTFYDAVCDSNDKCTSDHYPFASKIHIT